jgi:hypothetical protein
LPLLDEKDYFLDRHCVCLKFVLAGKSSEFRRMLTNYGKEHRENKEKQHLFREKKGKGFLNIDYTFDSHRFESNKFKLTASVTPFVPEDGRVSDVSKNMAGPDAFFDLLKNVQAKDLVGTSCTSFHFSSADYSAVGGLPMPTKIQLTNEIQEKLGEVQLGGFLLRFKASPIGVKEVDMEVEENNLTIDITIEYSLSSTEKLFEKSFGIAKEVVSLFVVKKL